MQRSFMRHASLAILTGILVGTSYIPFPPWAIFFCFVPLWISWFEESSRREIFWTGWLAQFVFNLIGYNWVAHTVHEFGHFPWWATIIVLILFCGFANLYIPLVGLIWHGFCRLFKIGPQGKLWSLVIFMCAGERIFPMIFDWNSGYPWMWAGFPAMHLADTVGFIGLSSISLLFNGFFLWAWWERRNQKTWWRAAAIPPLAFLAMNIWGYYHGQNIQQPDRHKKFLIVQANIENEEKLAAEAGSAFRDIVIGRFASLTQKGLQQSGPADFAVWPETAFPEVLDAPDMSYGYPLKLKAIVASLNTPLITGGYSRMPVTGKITNSFFVLSATGEWMIRPYHKTVLLAFGEYLPFGDYLPWVKKQIPEIGDFGRGPGPIVAEAGDVKLGPQICYEGLFDWFARAQANAGAQILVNLTNDSWYGTWQQPYQHGYETLARAIEVRRPFVRSTNTGMSVVILASGEVLEPSPLHKEWFHLYDVPYVSHPEPTIFMRWGYWLIPGLLALAILVITFRSRRQR